MDGAITTDPLGRGLTGLVLGGRYELLDAIGAGGMAVVWRARDHVLARQVAVKIVAGHPIRQEARAAAALSHPNIAQVHDYGEVTTGGRVFPYVVMELVEGGTLGARMAEGPIPPRQAMRICAEIAAALAAAHAIGLVHRDIKPANVMLGTTGAKVVDFGIAAATAPSGTGDLDPEVLGTPAYLAPERLLDDAVEPASDVYALGVVLYRLLCGHSPWTSEDTTQMLKAHIYVEPAALPPVPGVPDLVADLCDRCLIKDPSRRPSAREVAALLTRAATLPVPAAGTPRSRRRPAVAAALLAAGAAAVATWQLLPDGDSSTAGPAPAVAGTPSAAQRSGPLSAPPAPASLQPSARRSGAPLPPVAPLASLTTDQAVGTPPAPTGTAPTPPRATAPAAPPAGGPTTRPTPSTPAGGPAPGTTPPPAPTTPRDFSSAAGTLTATCPSAGTAQILSYEPRKTYKVQSADTGLPRPPPSSSSTATPPPR
ncbi:protein kinase domain-containing protein [Actinoplanes sp. URMC 104]|uniref:serine/threonine-protein kinase n=1 Tax=Actinoplanes sp. URMC 104 TaxID=3423409 RepID=UPI003F1CEDCC